MQEGATIAVIAKIESSGHNFTTGGTYAVWRGPVLYLLLCFCVAPCLIAQTGPDAAYQAKRQKASELFDRGKRLEALPLLEELAKASPKDDVVLVALAASLVDHAATLTDQEAASKERLRARDLLDRAFELGNTSVHAMNLSQLLRQLPASGTIKFSDNPQVDHVIRAGEAAFSRRDFPQALKEYAEALNLEPTNYSAVLFTGNTYDKQNQFAKGAEWYERAIQLEPNLETAYRYYADMLAREGDMAKARTVLIHAVVAEPYNRIVWRELHAWATLNKTHVNQLYIGVPMQDDKPRALPELSSVWRAYRETKAKWQNLAEFRKRFPEAKAYRHSLPEESEALTAAAKELENKSGEKIAESATADASLNLLMRLHRAGLIDPYVLFSLGDADIARDYPAYRAKNRNKLEEYLDEFVVPRLDPVGGFAPPESEGS